MGDRYVTGDTNWESFELPALIAMVNEKVDVPALVRLADDWRWTGEGTADAARALADALDELMRFWSGEAAGQARTDVALNAQWLFDLGTRASDMGGPVEEAAGAIKAAQDQMPHLPEPSPAGAPGSAPDGAAAGERAGGPLGAAFGAAVGGSDSAAEAARQQADLHRQAVETMRRFEAAAMGIDQSIPRFEGPSPVLRPRPAQPAPVRPPAPGPGNDSSGKTPTWQELTGPHDESATSGQQYTGAGGGGGASGGVPAQVGGGPVTGGPPGVMGGGRSSGPGAGTGAVPHHERVAGMLPAASAMPVDPDGPAGMGGAAPMAGMGAGAGGNKDDDHRRRYPFDADGPFAPDRKASPPVIGL